MQYWLLYCLNSQGRVSATEKLVPMSRAELRQVAAERLATCHGVEVWDGPICTLRLNTRPQAYAGPSED